MGITDSEEVSYFVTYATIILVKMVLMSPITGLTRIKNKVFANQEDYGKAGIKKDKKPIFGDDRIERLRRCHRNDLENIIPFFALGLLYALFSGASLSTVVWHYRVFVASRLIHTAVYLHGMQPARILIYLVGLMTNLSMAAQILMNNWNL